MFNNLINSIINKSFCSVIKQPLKHYIIILFSILLYCVTANANLSESYLINSDQSQKNEIPEMITSRNYYINGESELVGHNFKIILAGNEALNKISEEYAVSLSALQQVNSPQQLKDLAKGTTITIPNTFILPPRSLRNGIVINIPEKRLYYFPPDHKSVYIFPVALGRLGWETPLVKTSIRAKKAKPTWYIPQSIRDEVLLKRNKVLPEFIPPGPNNPLGDYALYLNFPGYLIHGTNNPKSIGNLVTSGCIRLHNNDVALLYSIVPVGTPVTIIHKPYKAAVVENNIYLEVYRPIHHAQYQYEINTSSYKQVLANVIAKKHAFINSSLVQKLLVMKSGVPFKIGSIDNHYSVKNF